MLAEVARTAGCGWEAGGTQTGGPPSRRNASGTQTGCGRKGIENRVAAGSGELPSATLSGRLWGNEGRPVNELAILNAMQAWHNPVLDPLVAVFTSTSNHGELWILLGIVLLCFRRTRKAGAGVLVAVALGAVVTNLTIKPLLMRPRPCDVNAAVAMIVPRPSGSSFPSGHTTAAFAAAAALWFARKPAAPAGLIAGVTVAAALMGI